jgi:hypothetical protein
LGDVEDDTRGGIRQGGDDRRAPRDGEIQDQHRAGLVELVGLHVEVGAEVGD